MKEAFSEGDEVIDVEANAGMFSLAARQIVSNTGFVYSFEPNPFPRNYLNRNLEINKIDNVKVYPIGLGESEGNFSFYVPYVNSGEGSLVSFSEYASNKFYEIQIEVKVGDDLISEVVSRIIKIDVEGDDNLEEPCDILLGHVNDDYIQKLEGMGTYGK